MIWDEASGDRGESGGLSEERNAGARWRQMKRDMLGFEKIECVRWGGTMRTTRLEEEEEEKKEEKKGCDYRINEKTI